MREQTSGEQRLEHQCCVTIQLRVTRPQPDQTRQSGRSTVHQPQVAQSAHCGGRVAGVCGHTNHQHRPPDTNKPARAAHRDCSRLVSLIPGLLLLLLLMLLARQARRHARLEATASNWHAKLHVLRRVLLLLLVLLVLVPLLVRRCCWIHHLILLVLLLRLRVRRRRHLLHELVHLCRLLLLLLVWQLLLLNNHMHRLRVDVLRWDRGRRRDLPPTGLLLHGGQRRLAQPRCCRCSRSRRCCLHCCHCPGTQRPWWLRCWRRLRCCCRCCCAPRPAVAVAVAAAKGTILCIFVVVEARWCTRRGPLLPVTPGVSVWSVALRVSPATPHLREHMHSMHLVDAESMTSGTHVCVQLKRAWWPASTTVKGGAVQVSSPLPPRRIGCLRRCCCCWLLWCLVSP